MNKEQNYPQLDYTQPAQYTQSLEGHKSMVQALAVLANGQLASGSYDGTIKLWDLNSGECLKILSRDSKYLSALNISADHLAASYKNIIKVWDVNSGKCFQTLTKLSFEIFDTLIFLNDNCLISSSHSGSGDGKIELWDIHSGQSLQTFHKKDWMLALTMLTNNRLASGTLKGNIEIFDINSDKNLQILKEHTDLVTALTVLADGSLISCSGDKTIKLWDLRLGKCVKTLNAHSDRVCSLTVLSDGYLASGSFDETIKLWEVNSARCLQTLKADNSVRALAYLNNGYLVGSSHNAIKLWKFSILDKKKINPQRLKNIDDFGEIKISIAIPYQQLTFGKELGRGSFGIVYKGEYQFGQVAIKTLLHQELKESLIEDFKKEASIMASLRSPFIVSLYGICLEKPHYSIVMEYMANGSLSNFIQSEKPIEWKIRYQIGIDVGGGLAYLHNHEMVHCDLKSLNILLDVNYRARISDFGLSKVKLDTSFSTVSGGSTRWMAPELFEEGAKSTKAADVFAYGVVLWELGSRKFPFATTRNEAVPMLVCRGKREEITKDTPPSMAKLIAKCWDGRAEIRPPMDEAVKTLQTEQAAYKF
jgi:WD40 repeat protein